MISRVALFAASIAASLTLAVGLALAGFAPSPPQADAAAAQPVVATAEPAATPLVQVDTAFIAPQVKPAEVTVKKAVTTSGRVDDEGEGGDDD